MCETKKALQHYVDEAWQNACENGYEQTLRAMAPEEIAVDMISYDASIEALLGYDMPNSLLEQRITELLPQVMH